MEKKMWEIFFKICGKQKKNIFFIKKKQIAAVPTDAKS
jgi:hypothetical protein